MKSYDEGWNNAVKACIDEIYKVSIEGQLHKFNTFKNTRGNVTKIFEIFNVDAELSKLYKNSVPDNYNNHDVMCPNAEGSCCPWMGDCDCQCNCDLINRVREDESMNCYEHQKKSILQCISVVENLSHKPDASTDHYLSAMRSLLEKP